jgi:hypothetical protein
MGVGRGLGYGANNSTAACEAEGQRANQYAHYDRSQLQTQETNNLTLY